MTNQISPSPDLLGARIRPVSLRAARELRYQFVPSAEQTDTSQIVSVGVFMPPVKAQRFGSCVGHSVTSAAECLHNLHRQVQGPLLDPYAVYYWGRLKDNFYGEPPGSDTGLVIATGFDVSLGGIPQDHLWPTPSSPAEAPPDHLREDAPNQDWLAVHQPVYRENPGGFVGGIWAAIRNNQPVVLGSAWYNNWFSHDRILPENTGVFAGYHAICAYAGIPPGYYGHEELVVIRNSWGGYTDIGDLTSILPEAQPGDVLVPRRCFENGAVFEVRAAGAEPLTPEPSPFDDCRDELAAQRDADEQRVLRVRDTYSRRWSGWRALDEAARRIREERD